MSGNKEKYVPPAGRHPTPIYTLPDLSSGGAGNGSSNVTYTGATTGQTIVYNSVSDTWAPGVPSLALDNLTDVTIATPATKQVVRYNGTTWVNAQAALTDMSDFVTPTTWTTTPITVGLTSVSSSGAYMKFGTYVFCWLTVVGAHANTAGANGSIQTNVPVLPNNNWPSGVAGKSMGVASAVELGTPDTSISFSEYGVYPLGGTTLIEVAWREVTTSPCTVYHTLFFMYDTNN